MPCVVSASGIKYVLCFKTNKFDFINQTKVKKQKNKTKLWISTDQHGQTATSQTVSLSL